MTDEARRQGFPDPRDSYGRLVRVETKLDDLKESVKDLRDDVKSARDELDDVMAHIDNRRGASVLAQRLWTGGMMFGSALVGAGALAWLEHAFRAGP
jgi:hypothetical protein